MSNRWKYALAWLSILALVAVASAVVVLPVWLIQPFASQTQRGLTMSFYFRSWSPILTIATSVVCFALAVYIWINSRRWFGKAALFVPIAFILLFSWFARQNHFEWMFNPLASKSFVAASEANFVADNEMVLSVVINGDAVAFPVRQMAYHHVVQDVVGGMPITATY